LVDHSRTDPAIDADYFPETQSSFYWSSSPYAGYGDGAWVVSFYDGYDFANNKGDGYSVRLVRSGR
jgi:hypothetical protein